VIIAYQLSNSADSYKKKEEIYV